MSVYDGIDKKTALDIINSLVNTEGAEIGITLSKEFLKSLLNAINSDEQNNCVKWHPYTQEKPSEDKMYLVTYHYVNVDGKPTDTTTYAEFKKGHFHNVPRVTAWAELPKPYEYKKE